MRGLDFLALGPLGGSGGRQYCCPMYRLLLMLVGLTFSAPLFAAGISTTNKYAWAENAGWLNFNSTNNSASVQVYADHLEGYVWAENIGWISLKGTAQDSTPYGVNHDGNGHLSGYAWSENAGWINFGATAQGPGVTINLVTGQFDGYAWGENIGYLHFFRNASPAYHVAVLNYDGDGQSAEEGDCNDNDPAIYPGATELCDRKDNDCDPVTPETCALGCPQL